ncbi:MAG: hypothetical protein WBO46_26025 [Caldilineaceae bacterium]
MRAFCTALFLCLLAAFIPARAQAIAIPIDTDRIYFDMDAHSTSLEKDTGNASLPLPSQVISSSVGNTASVSISAAPGEAGVVKASVGLSLTWETGGQEWDAVQDIPVEVRVDFRYNLTSHWTTHTGSSNAGVSITPVGAGWFDFLGFESQESDSRGQRAVVSFITTPAKLDQQLLFHVYAQAHTKGGQEVQNNAQATVTVNSVNFIWRPPEPDLEATGLEVTQAVQDLNNSVRLAAGKRTFVRFHVRSTTHATFRTFAHLRAESATELFTLRPVNPGQLIHVRPNPSREVTDHAFLFELPTSLTAAGTLTLTAELNPQQDWRPRNPVESSYANNSRSVTVNFEATPGLHLVVYRVTYNTADGRTWTTPLSHTLAMVSWLRAVYPISAVSIRDRTLAFTGGLPSCERINSELRSARRWDSLYDFVGVGAKVPANAHYYALVDDRGYEATDDATTPDDLDTFMRGCSDLPGFASSGPAGVPRLTAEGKALFTSWETDGSYGDWYAGHELAHSFGRRHPGRCRNQPRDAAHPATGDHPNGDISPSAAGNNAAYGFDIRSRQVLSGTLWKDVMTYCDRQWISDFTSESLQTSFQSQALAAQLTAQSSAPVAVAADSLLVQGLIAPDNSGAILAPIFHLPGVPAPAPAPSGEYAILLKDGSGGELARIPFTPSTAEYGPPAPGEEGSETVAGLLFAEQIAPASGAERVDIVHGGTVLTNIQPGAAPPTVTVTSPNGGEIVAGDTLTVTWSASDPDGDPLLANIQYSPDGGASWVMLAQRVAGPSAAISTTNTPAGAAALVRVWVSDGLHSAADISDAAFTVPNRAPAIEITSPPDGTTAVLNQTVHFAAIAIDPDSGLLDGSVIAWSSHLDGALGTGDDLAYAELTQGPHIISAVADDGAGGVITATRTITVVYSPALAPAVADSLLINPSEISLQPGAAITRGLIYADNQNTAKGLEWQANSDASWLTLGAVSGPTPDEIRVGYNGSGLAAGHYTGTLTITSPDVADVRTVPVYLALAEEEQEKEQLWLPVVAGQ